MIFCSLWDGCYQAKGLALLSSIRRWMPDAWTHVLALDELVEIRQERVSVTPLAAVMSPELCRVRQGRSDQEFAWTLSALWTWHVMEHHSDTVIYVDADTFLFGNLAPVFDEIGMNSIAICPHRWSPEHRENLRLNGKYNVGLVYFRHTGKARVCLKRWKDQCLEWCFYDHLDGKFADQGYLDEWPETYDAHVIEHLGVDLAPWNQRQYDYCLAEDGSLLVDNEERCDPLLLYHFAEFGTLRRGRPVRTNYALHPMVERYVYPAYEKEIDRWMSGSSPK